jgi:YidC/Oxa1 family membrane protein insertase
MDRRTIVFVVLLLLLMLFYHPLLKMAGLGRYLEPQRRPVPVAVDTVRTDTAARSPVVVPGGTTPVPAMTAGGTATALDAVSALQVSGIPSAAGVAETTFALETPLYRAEFSNRGARLLSVALKRYVTAHGASAKDGRPLHVPAGREVPPGDRVVLTGGPLLELGLGSGAGRRPLTDVVYAVRESTDASGAVCGLTFTAGEPGPGSAGAPARSAGTGAPAGPYIRQTWRIRPGSYAFDLEVETRGIPDSWRLNDYSLQMRNWPTFTETDRKTDERYVRVVSLVGKNLRRSPPQSLFKNPRTSEEGAVEWAGVQSRYFLCVAAIEEAIPRATAGSGEEVPLSEAELKLIGPRDRTVRTVGTSSLIVGMPPVDQPVQRFLVYTGPSDLRQLSRLGHDLPRVVDLGWNWMRPISEVLLRLLDWIFMAVRNYGLAILALALLVRILLHPLNTSSLKSMRAMQKLQPEVERLREKYKKDAPAMNTALMALYKENKVNPAGGCLPMLLQMPLLMALYQVLLNAIELRQAPFVGWITDLSAPDMLFSVSGFPVRLLPLLMTGSGFLLQRFTPTNPQQAPTAYMMNLFMLFIFYNLPSGLVFYWTVMNLASAAQQWMVLRTDSSAIVVVEEPHRGKKRGG